MPASTAVPFWRSIVARDVGLLVMGVAVASLLGVGWLQREARHDVEMRFGMAATSIAGTAAPSISAHALAQIDSDDDVASPAFRTVRARLQEVQEANGLGEHQIYVLRPAGDHYTFVVMLQERTFVGDAYRPPEELLRYYEELERTMAPVATGLYTDDHGTFISGLAPIFDSQGRLAGILHVDEDVEQVMAEVRRSRIPLFGLAIGLGLVLWLGGVVTYLRLGRRVAHLVEGTEAIREERYDHRVPLEGRDELAVVAGALNDTFPRLRERYEMLKFLPRHTQDMIRTEEHVDLAVARRVDVAVLESDIRGFTRLSEHMSPEDTIAMLNLYIRAQAEVIGKHGGSIDKYMGDAVLAVFDGPGHCQRALDAALESQQVVARMNEEGVFERPVRIGVGVSDGEVVMGNMGSEDRMEHTVIGAVVNLAARLCSAARAGEVVVAASVIDDPDVGVSEAIEVKGFEAPVACVRIQVAGA